MGRGSGLGMNRGYNRHNGIVIRRDQILHVTVILGERLMIVFVRRIPADLTRRELEALVAEVITPRFAWLPFGVKGEVVKCEIIRIREKETGAMERHGLVTIRPDEAALKVIKRLNHTRINGKLVEVREYKVRAYQRDRRRTEEGQQSEGQDDRRQRDRRRRNLEVQTEKGPSVEGLRDFHRTYSS